MKSSYIWRTFSSTTVLLVSFLSSSQASQNIMFSSLNSVRRNCLKQLRPAALFITFSNDTVQERASSRVGFGLKNKKANVSVHCYLIILIVPHYILWNVVCCVCLLPFFTVSSSLWPVLKGGSLNCLILTPNSQTAGKKTARAVLPWSFGYLK